MNEEDTIRHIREGSPLNEVRMVLSGIIGTAEQRAIQDLDSPIELRRREFLAVERILEKAEQVGLITRNDK